MLTVRVPGSVLGLMRSTRPAKDRPRIPSMSTAAAHSLADLRHVGHRHLRLHLELAQIDDGHQRRIERELLARLHMALRHDSRDRCAHDRIVKLDLGLLDLRARSLDCGQLRLVRRIGRVERVLRDEVLLDELGVDLTRALSIRQLCLRELVRRRALSEQRAQLRGVELGDDLAGADLVAFAHEHPLDLGRKLRAHGRLRYRLQASGEPPIQPRAAWAGDSPRRCARTRAEADRRSWALATGVRR